MTEFPDCKKMIKNEDSFDRLATDIDSVGSCESLVREEIDERATSISLGDLYSETQVGQCLNTVLNEMMMEGDININQQMALRRAYNYVHHQSFEQCQNKLHLNVSGKLTEFSSLSNSSSFTVKVRIPILII